MNASASETKNQEEQRVFSLHLSLFLLNQWIKILKQKDPEWQGEIYRPYDFCKVF